MKKANESDIRGKIKDLKSRAEEMRKKSVRIQQRAAMEKKRQDKRVGELLVAHFAPIVARDAKVVDDIAGKLSDRDKPYFLAWVEDERELEKEKSAKKKIHKKTTQGEEIQNNG